MYHMCIWELGSTCKHECERASFVPINNTRKAKANAKATGYSGGVNVTSIYLVKVKRFEAICMCNGCVCVTSHHLFWN